MYPRFLGVSCFFWPMGPAVFSTTLASPTILLLE
jgi:hypothetical protein